MHAASAARPMEKSTRSASLRYGIRQRSERTRPSSGDARQGQATRTKTEPRVPELSPTLYS